jgi:hypothetical protein
MVPASQYFAQTIPAEKLTAIQSNGNCANAALFFGGIDGRYGSNKMSHFAKAGLTDSLDQHELFGAFEGAIFFPMGYDPLGDLASDSRDLFQIGDRSGIDVDSVR